MSLAFTPIFAALIASALATAAGGAAASPIALTQPEFAAATSGRATLVEDFERFAPGDEANPLVLVNGIARLPKRAIIQKSFFLCPDASRCLVDGSDLYSARLFTDLPAGTTWWGTDFGMFDPPHLMQITAEGVGGTLTLQTGKIDFIGFHDPLGLTAITFLNLGTPDGGFGNYGFDNITTAGGRDIIAPSTLALLGAALAGAAWLGSRKSSVRLAR